MDNRPAPEQRPVFSESHDPVARDEILARTVTDLRLDVKGTRLQRLVERLHEELGRAGLTFRPPVYLSDEWGCPDLVPIIGVPFYLADAGLTRLHGELMEGVEAESDEEIMRYLRHEAGHAFNYAYRPFESDEWTDLFGPFSRPYPDQYQPNPFSRSYVRHLPAWYAQKHPDEDFAETFAIWLDPASNWREAYAGWGAMKKLEYVDRLARSIGATAPPVTAAGYRTQDEAFRTRPIGELYGALSAPPAEIPRFFDAPLRDIFGPDSAGEGEPGSKFLRRQRRAIVAAVYHWTGLDDTLVRALLVHLEERSAGMKLRVDKPSDATLVQVVAFVTTLCMNHLQTGDYVRK